MQNQWGYQTSPKDRVLMKITKFNIYMEEFIAYTVERIKSKKQLVFNISCDVVFNSFKTLKYAQRSKAIALYAAVLNSTSNSMHTAFNDFEEYCDNLCDWYNIYDKEQLKADIEDAYHSQEITN
jgi:RNase P/RNase MRP subunit p29